VVVGRRAEVLEEAVRKLKALGIDAFQVQGDVRNYESIKRAVDETVQKFNRLGTFLLLFVFIFDFYFISISLLLFLFFISI
jgi:NADP-dependent 3-hydroxy acid dehydrogenase YdfG